MDSIRHIREQFVRKLYDQKFVGDTVEILGASFIASDKTIFGKPNEDYIRREIQWYLSKSLFVDDIPVKTPLIWRQIASDSGEINSNYGYLFLAKENGSQLDAVVDHLIQDSGSRRATAVYTNPFIHKQWNRDGMSDFICTNAVQYLIRDGKLEVVVQMRSNDAIFGYRNDYAWQKYAQDLVVDKLASNGLVYEPGNIIWNAASLHIYKRHFELISNYAASGDYLTEVS